MVEDKSKCCVILSIKKIRNLIISHGNLQNDKLTISPRRVDRKKRDLYTPLDW